MVTSATVSLLFWVSSEKLANGSYSNFVPVFDGVIRDRENERFQIIDCLALHQIIPGLREDILRQVFGNLAVGSLKVTLSKNSVGVGVIAGQKLRLHILDNMLVFRA
jgi:hypothetical protein